MEPERQQETAWSVGEQRAWIGRGLPLGVDEHAVDESLAPQPGRPRPAQRHGAGGEVHDDSAAVGAGDGATVRIGDQARQASVEGDDGGRVTDDVHVVHRHQAASAHCSPYAPMRPR